MMVTSYPGMREHLDRMAFIAKDHWRQYESNADHTDRVECAEIEAQEWFEDATARQSAIYAHNLENLQGLHGPRYDRAREHALWRWYEATKRERNLMALTFDDLMRCGEVSPETAGLWDALDHAEAA